MTIRTFAFAGFLAAACGASPQPEPAAARATPATPQPIDDTLPFGVRVSGHGPPMILIPGLASAGDVWATTVEHEKAHFTCYVLELPGFAGRPALGGPGPILPAVRDGVAKLIRDRHLDKPVIVGHSLGGFVALDLARSEPALVGKLVIIDTLPFLPAATQPDATAESMRAVLPQMKKGLVDGDQATFEDKERAILATMITDPAKQKLAFDWAMKSDRAAVFEMLAEIMTTDLRPKLGAIAAPTLVIETWIGWGMPKEQTIGQYHKQYAELHGAKEVVHDTSKHFVMWDDPSFLFAQMDAFL